MYNVFAIARNVRMRILTLLRTLLDTGDVSVYLIGWYPGSEPCVSPGDVSAFHTQTAGSESS